MQNDNESLSDCSKNWVINQVIACFGLVWFAKCVVIVYFLSGIPYHVHELKPGQVWISRGDAVHCFAHLGPSAGSESLGVAINFVGTTWLLVCSAYHCCALVCQTVSRLSRVAWTAFAAWTSQVDQGQADSGS